MDFLSISKTHYIPGNDKNLPMKNKLFLFFLLASFSYVGAAKKRVYPPRHSHSFVNDPICHHCGTVYKSRYCRNKHIKRNECDQSKLMSAERFLCFLKFNGDASLQKKSEIQ